MIYANCIKPKGVKYKTYNYASFKNALNTEVDENLLPIASTTNTFNFCMDNGALRTGMGICEPQICTQLNNRNSVKNIKSGSDNFIIRKAWIFTKYESDGNHSQYLIVCDDTLHLLNCYITPNLQPHLQSNYPTIQLTEVPNSLFYKINNVNVLLLASGTRIYAWDMSGAPVDVYVPKIVSMCVHNERLYLSLGGDRKCIWYSDELNPLYFRKSLEEGGYFELLDERGGVNKLITFEDSLYAFRDFGISKIETYNNRRDFNITHLFVGASRIYEKTIALCGDKILFLTSTGLCSFNGSSTEYIDLKLGGVLGGIDNYSAVSAYVKGSYYLACRVNFNDGQIVGCENGTYENNAIIKIDTVGGDINVMRGVDIRDFNVISHVMGEYLFCYYKDGDVYKDGMICMDGKIKGVATRKYWRSSVTDFGEADKKKIIKKFSVYTKENITLNIKVDNKVYTYALAGSDKLTAIRPNLIGKEVSIEIISDTENPMVSDPKITVGVL